MKRLSQIALAGGILSCLILASDIAQAGAWNGFLPEVRYRMTAPVVCFSSNKTVNATLSGIAVGTNGNGVTIFSGYRDNAFTRQTTLPGGFTRTVDMNYLNADTLPDVVVPSYWGGSFTIYLGTPDGRFTPNGTYSVEGHCTWVITADFNEDGKIDIAAAHNGSGQPLHLYIYLGNGDGSFTRFQKYPTQIFSPSEIQLADINNDTHVDLAYSLSSLDAGVVFLGNGDGTFETPMMLIDTVGSHANRNSNGFSLADLNSDGKIDWIGAQDNIDSVVIRYGDGTGRFPGNTTLYLPHTYDIETADLDANGTTDIIASNADSVVCFLQRGDGTFILSAAVKLEGGPVNLHVLDLNNDTYPDLIVSNLDSTFSVLMNTGNPLTGVDRRGVHPTVATLFQNYPNPFNPATVIGYQLATRARVRLKLFDVLGKELTTLVDEMQDAGNHEVRFDGSRLGSGVYFYQLRTGNSIDNKKMTIVK